MKKYCVMEGTIVVDNINDVENECCISDEKNSPNCLGEFDTEEEAISLFAMHDAKIERTDANHIKVTEVWVEEVEFDEDGELITIDDVVISTDLADEKFNAMMGYEIPEVEIDMITNLSKFSADIEGNCFKFKITEDTDAIFTFERVSADEDKIKITDIVLE